MWGSIKGLFSSRKFWLTVIGTAVCGALKYAGVSEEFITVIAGLFGVSLVSRAVSDLGPK